MSILLLMSTDRRDLTFKELTQVDLIRLSTMGKTLSPTGVSSYQIFE